MKNLFAHNLNNTFFNITKLEKKICRVNNSAG